MKCSVINSPFFSGFAGSIADKTLDTTSEAIVKLQDQMIDKIFLDLTSKYSGEKLLHLFGLCDEKVRSRVEKKLTAPLIHELEIDLKSSRSKRKATPSKSYSIGADLNFSITKKLINLSQLIDKTSFNYKKIADDIAFELLQCAIINFNEFHEDKQKSTEAINNSCTLLNAAKDIAISAHTQKDILKNLEYFERIIKNRGNYHVPLTKERHGVIAILFGFIFDVIFGLLSFVFNIALALFLRFLPLLVIVGLIALFN